MRWRPPPGPLCRGRHRGAPCHEQRPRWRSPDPWHLRSLDRQRRPVRDAGCWPPIAQPPHADRPAIVVRLLPTRLQRATANPSATSPPQAADVLPSPCNEPLVSLPPGVQRNSPDGGFPKTLTRSSTSQPRCPVASWVQRRRLEKVGPEWMEQARTMCAEHPGGVRFPSCDCSGLGMGASSVRWGRSQRPASSSVKAITCRDPRTPVAYRR
jgi:hypothetical protein